MIGMQLHVRPCLYCHESVATNAHRCPHCGGLGPTNRLAFTFNMRWPSIVAAGFAFGILGLWAFYLLAK